MADVNVDRKNPILKKSKISTGINDLDILLEGGYLKEGLIMISGHSGTEKNAFAFHFTQAGIDLGEAVIYITADMSHEEINKKADALGFDFKKANSSGELIFIDCYSSSSDPAKKSDSQTGIISLPGANSLNDLSIAIKSILQEHEQKKIRVVFHSLSTFILYNPASSIIKFIQFVGGRLKKSNATTLFIVDEGMHEKTLLTSIEHMMDEKYSIGDGENFSISSASLPMSIPLKMGSAGIEIK
ncbi:MAG: ATPase domain-containing protein [Candidatus Micrarchaeia archaeon]